MLITAVFVGGLSGFIGALISYLAPKMPTGPWIIIVLSSLAFGSILLGADKGIIYKWLKRVAFKQKVLEENILKIFYHLSFLD